MSTVSERAARAAAREPRGRRRRGRAVRPAAIVLVIAGIAALVLWLQRSHAREHVTIEFDAAESGGANVQVDFFPDQLAFTTPSPPPAIGSLDVARSDSVTVGDEHVPGHALVRYRSPGAGAGFVHVKLGEPTKIVPLRAPSALRGRVGERLVQWCFGAYVGGLLPVAGAEVTVMGGGEHGVDLATARTDADGNFAIDGIDGALDGLGLRVRARGFGIVHVALPRVGDGARVFPVVALARTAAHAGELIVPEGLDVTGLRVLARGVPGVDAAPETNGAFVLDHVPLGLAPDVLVYGLPPTWTQLPASVVRGSPVRVKVVPAAVVRGRVIDAASGSPLGGALVWCGRQPAARADEDGRYELRHLVAGDADIEASWERDEPRRRRSPPWRGRKHVRLEPGRYHEDVDILMTDR